MKFNLLNELTCFRLMVKEYSEEHALARRR